MTFKSGAVETELEVHPRFFLRRTLGTIKYDVGLLTLQTAVDWETFPHIRSIFL